MTFDIANVTMSLNSSNPCFSTFAPKAAMPSPRRKELTNADITPMTAGISMVKKAGNLLPSDEST